MDPHEALSDTPEWPSASIAAVWTEVQRLTALDDEALLYQLDDLIGSDIVGGSRVPLSTLITVFVAVWSHSIARRPYFLRSLRLPFESLEHRADRENALDALAAVKHCCPYLQEVIDDDLHWTHHPIPGDGGGRSQVLLAQAPKHWPTISVAIWATPGVTTPGRSGLFR